MIKSRKSVRVALDREAIGALVAFLRVLILRHKDGCTLYERGRKGVIVRKKEEYGLL